MASKTTLLAKILLHRHNMVKTKMVNGKTLPWTIFIILRDLRGNRDLSTL